MKRILMTGLLALFGFLPGEDSKQFTDWSAPVNLGPVVNSTAVDSCVSISKDGLMLIFSSTRQSPGTTNRDLYVSKRDSKEAPWGVPLPLTMLNTTVWESCPALSLDEHRLYFTRPGVCGGYDIWVSHRQDRRDDFGWELPANLGCAADGYVNSEAGDQTPTFFEDEDGRTVMYFSSNRLGSASFDHYQSVMSDDDTFGPATPITELNSEYGDQGITVRRDGLEVIFLSARPYAGKVASMTNLEFWTATRESTKDPWSVPIPVPSLGSPASAQGRITLSFDGREIYFTSWNEPTTGNADLWVAKREKVGGPKTKQ